MSNGTRLALTGDRRHRRLAGRRYHGSYASAVDIITAAWRAGRCVTVADRRALTRWVVSPTRSIGPENADLPGKARLPRLPSCCSRADQGRTLDLSRLVRSVPTVGPIPGDLTRAMLAIADVQAVAAGSWRPGERDALAGWLGRLGYHAPYLEA